MKEIAETINIQNKTIDRSALHINMETGEREYEDFYNH